MADRECMTSHSGDTGMRNASSSRSTHVSGDDVSSVGYHLKIQRDTLYVSGSTGAALNEWIVSYSSTDGPEARAATRASSNISTSDTGSLLPLALSEDLDLSDSRWLDSFSISRVLASHFFSSGKDGKCIRLFTSLERPIELLAGIYGILLSGTILDLVVNISKKNEDSGDVVILVSLQSGDSELITYTPPSAIRCEDPKLLVSEYMSEFAREAIGNKVRYILDLPNETSFLSAIRAVATLTYALAPASSLSFQLEPSDSCFMRIYVWESKKTILKISTAKPSFIESFDPIVSINVGAFFYVVELTSALLRLFMAGYCCVKFVGVKLETDIQLYELCLILKKYFAFNFKIDSNGIEFVRKCNTYDILSEKEDISFMEFKSVLSVITEMVGQKRNFNSALPRSSDELMELIVSVTEIVNKETVFKFEKNFIEICPPESVDWSEIKLDRLHPAIVPDVDITIDGPEWEARLEELEARLNALGETDDRLSVLLVEKKLSGLGIWTVAQMSTHVAEGGWGHFEIISERAVTTVLKNSVRLFIKRVPPVPGPTVARCPRIVVEGSESRITLATELFAALNAAPNGYIVMESGTPHCAFLALMAVIIVNGWSRSIMQRVETRTFTVENKDDEKALFLLRLILN